MKRLIKQLFGVYIAALLFRFGTINSDFTPTGENSGQFDINLKTENSYEKNHSELLTDNQEVHSPRAIIKTGSGVIFTSGVDFCSAIPGGGRNDTLDEKLIKSIISKVSESESDIPSINKIIKKLAEVTLEIGTNDKLLRILVELEKPIAQSPIFVEGFQPKLPRHKNRDEVEWKKGNKISTPFADYLSDHTKRYGHREGCNMPRSVSEKFETNAVRKLANKSLKDPMVKREYKFVKSQLEDRIHPVNLSDKSTFVSSTKVLVKKGEGRYMVEISDTHADILGLSSRTNQGSMEKFQKLMNELYDLNLKGY